MNLCVVSFKECWQGPDGRWVSYGGFPLQMKAICSLFEHTDLLVVSSHSREGGLPLPGEAQVTPLREPVGLRARRKLSVIANLDYYLATIGQHVKRADAVHVPLPGDMALLGMLSALFFRKRLLARYGGSWVPTSVTTTMNRVTRGLMRWFSGGRNVMMATGEGDTPPARRMHWIFASALSQEELDRIRPDLQRGLQSPPRAVYAGRLSPEKGCAQLVQAIALLRSEGFKPMPLVTLLGHGLERPRLESLARQLGCQDHIRFAGQVDRRELSSQMHRADFCIQPSLTEGFSKAWLDALAHGLPVIASSVGAAPGVIGGTGERGWLAPPGNVAALAQQIRDVITGPIDWPALRLRCRTYAEVRTLESWAARVGEICAQSWNCRLVDGKLVLPEV